MEDRKTVTTRLNRELVRKVKVLAAGNEKYFNDILEEAMTDVLKKYEKKGQVDAK